MTPDPDDDLGVPADPGSVPRRSALRRTLVLGLVAVAAVLAGAALASTVADDGGAPLVGADRADVAGSDGTTNDAPARLDAGPRSGRTDQPLPTMTLEGFADAPPVELTAYRGTALLVNFWATWCAPCVEEMPDIQQVADALDGRAAVLGVNVQDAPANAEAFVEELGVGYDLALDPAGELYAEVRAFGMPTTLLVDAGGTIVYRHTGPLDDAELLDLVGEHLGVSVAATRAGTGAEASASP